MTGRLVVRLCVGVEVIEMVLPASSSRQARRLVALVAVLSAFGSVLLVGGARSAGQASGLIAFARPDGIYVMRADGTGIRPIRRAVTARGASGLAWSPDGSRLAYVAFDRGKPRSGGGVWVMNADGSHPVLIAKLSFGPSRPTWSPDSKRIAFAQPPGAHNAIWIVNADGTGLHQVAVRGMPRVGVAAAAWSPDGSRFALAAGGWTIPGGGIYLVRTDGTGLQPLVHGKGEAGQPSWSPDGQRIAYTSALGRQVKPGFWSLEQRDEEISVVDVHTGEQVRLTHNGVPDYDPSWSPDGSRIMFVGAYARHRSAEIYTINPDGTGFTRLTYNHLNDSDPAWQGG